MSAITPLKSKLLSWCIPTLLCIAVVSAYLSFGAPLQTEEQVRYEKWLKTLELDLKKHRTSSAPAPFVSVELRSLLAARPLRWTLRSTENRADNEDLLRVLGVLREAKLFPAETPSNEELKSSGIHLTVRGEQDSFETLVTPEQLEKNVRAQLLLKLLEIHASDRASTDVAMRSAKAVPSQNLETRSEP